MTSLPSCTSWSMSCSRNHVMFLRMKVVMRFQWITFRRQRILLWRPRSGSAWFNRGSGWGSSGYGPARKDTAWEEGGAGPELKAPPYGPSLACSAPFRQAGSHGPGAWIKHTILFLIQSLFPGHRMEDTMSGRHKGKEKAGWRWTHRRTRKSRKAATRATTETQWPR